MQNPSLPPRPSMFEQQLRARQKRVARMMVATGCALGGALLLAVVIAVWPSAPVEPMKEGRSAAREAAGALHPAQRGQPEKTGQDTIAAAEVAPPAEAAKALPVTPQPQTAAVVENASAAKAGSGAAAPASAAAKPATRAGQPQAASPSKADTLTREQRAMLERMGAGEKIVPGSRSQASDAAKPAKSTPGLSAAQLSTVVTRGRPNLQRCYETALRGTGSEQAVRADIAITVSAAGNVTRVSTSGASLPGMDACIARTVKQWRFPSASEPTETKFPLVFQPGS